MQGHRGKMVSLPETFEIDNASSSSSTSAAVDQQLRWNDLQSPPDTLLPNDYMLPSNDSLTFMNPNVGHQQRSMNTVWNFGESSSSTSATFDNSEWKSESGWPSTICTRQGTRINDQLYAPGNNVFSLGGVNMNPLCPQGDSSSSPALNRGYVREESSVVNRRLPCKRKSREGDEDSEWHTHHSGTASGSSSSVPPFTEQIGPSLGLGLARPDPAESSQRNFRLRAHNSSSGQNSLRLPFSSSPVSQSPTLHPFELPPPSALQSQGQGALFHASVTPQLGTWARSSVSRNPVLNLDSPAHNEACIPRNNEENLHFVPPRLESRALAQNIIFPGNVGRSSASSTPAQLRRRSRYQQRLFEHARRQGISPVSLGGHSSSSNPPFPQEVSLPSGPSNLDHHHQHRSALLMERQANNVLGIPYSIRPWFPSEGRHRLASEFHSVLEMVCRGDGLRFEDMMMVDPSMLFRVADIHDRHRDMRLDVDSMSYEELLALEERIGNVGTGLSQETILTHIKQHKHTKLVKTEAEVEPCCICQEDYKDGEDVGTLDCGHDFHRDCVKQWLTHKNLCPICKTTGLATT